MKGNLKDITPTQVLNIVNLAKKSGTLFVERKDANARLSFREGKLVYAAIGDADGSLLSVLVRAGRIKPELAQALARRAAEIGDQQLGLLLIQKDYISRADIIKSVRSHTLAAVNQFAGWNEGAFFFDSTANPGDGRITVPIDLENVILQIGREQLRDKELEETIPSLDVRLKFTKREHVNLDELRLSKDEWRVLKLITEKNTIRMIANELKLSEKQIRRIVGTLREAGLVELAKAERPPDERTKEQKEKDRGTVLRLINFFQGTRSEAQP